jgi:hypothetical protein
MVVISFILLSLSLSLCFVKLFEITVGYAHWFPKTFGLDVNKNI